MEVGNVDAVTTKAIGFAQTVEKLSAICTAAYALLGPITGLIVWLLPLGVDATVQKAFAIVAFMVIYWIMEPVDHAVTALIGCYLFWSLGVAKFSLAFSGFASTTPWFIYGAILMGEAASRTGLAKRIGYMVILKIGTSYSRLVFGIAVLSFLLNFLVPSGMARLALMAPMVIGLVDVFGLGQKSNVAKGLFIVLTASCSLLELMIMSGAASILTRGIIEEQTGVQVLWSQWFIAFLPASLISVFVCWFVILWLYPGERLELPGGKRHLQDAVQQMGLWTLSEKKVFVWMLLALTLWGTDFAHPIRPDIVALGIGLLMALPRIGVLDTKAIKQVNFLPIIFSAGALSMGNVLLQARALDVSANSAVEWIEPVLSNSFRAAVTLYWGGFLYHFVLPNRQSMLITSLPLLLRLAIAHGCNPVAIGLVWTFTGGATLFAYQSAILVMGYSYGYFDAKDLLKVGAVLTIVEGILLMFLVTLYWPLIGLSWAAQ